MKKTVFLIMLCAAPVLFKAQTGTPLAMYAGNQLIFNPGFAGAYDLFSANLSVRHQWVNIPNSPKLMSFNAHAPFQSQRNAMGFVFQREVWGPQFVHTTNITYAHKIFFNPTTFLSLGLQAGLLNTVTDWNMVTFVMHPEDPVYWEDGGRQVSNRFDMNLGAYLQAEDFYLGFSVRHLTMPRFDEVRMDIDGREHVFHSHVRRQFFVMGGYNIALSRDLDLRPHFLARYKHTNPVSLSVGANLVYDNRFFVGSNFMTGQRAVSLVFMAEVMEGLRIGYSFDMNFGIIRPFQRGSHEVSVNYFIPLWNRFDDVRVRRNWQ
ncbi:MAG: PorP/SprF family type IX secretion system membrane protein [Bacteroidales bacterium]|nr:PorP/SprF family type IX secretion system membrane protein [Bacteroidales bacterium]